MEEEKRIADIGVSANQSACRIFSKVCFASKQPYIVTEEMVKEWQDTFEVIAQGASAISLDQLSAILKSMGHVIYASELQTLLGTEEMVTFNDFVDIMAYREKLQDYESELKMAFRSFDIEKMGFLYGDVFKHILLNMGDKLSYHDVQKIMFLFDLDDDDDEEIDYDDIIHAMIQKVTFDD